MFETGDRMGGWQITSRLGNNVWRCQSATNPPRGAALRLLSAPDERRLRTRVEWLKQAKHPGLVRLGTLAAWGEQTSLVMAYVPGPTLAEVRPRTAGDLFAAARQVTEVVAHLHALGTAHGALSLRHVRQSVDHKWVLVDPWLPSAQRFAARGGGEIEPSIEDDICALAAMLFELYTGRCAVRSRPDASLPPAEGLDPGPMVPPPIRDWIRRATSPAPGERPPVSVLRARLIVLEGTVAVSLPTFDPRARSVAPPPPAAHYMPVSAIPPRAIDPSLLMASPPADELPPELVWLGLFGALGVGMCFMAVFILIVFVRIAPLMSM